MPFVLDRTVEFINSSMNLKIKKGQLIAVLIIVELIGILVLAWYLRVPLYKKYLTVSERTYSISKLSPGQKYLFTQGDFVVGNTTAGNQVVALLRNETDLSKKTKFRIPVSESGSWALRLPEGLAPGSYRLTIGVFAGNNASISLNTYKIRVLSSSVFSNDRTVKEFLSYLNSNSPSLPSSGLIVQPEDIKEVNESVGNEATPLQENQPVQTPVNPILDN